MARTGAEAGEAGRVMNCLKLGRPLAVPTMSDLKKSQCCQIQPFNRRAVVRSRLFNDAVI